MYDLGLTDEDFGVLSYEMLEALLSRLKADERRLWGKVGTLATCIVNTGFCRPDKPMEIKDFMPEDEQEKQLSEMGPEEQAVHLINMFNRRTYR